MRNGEESMMIMLVEGKVGFIKPQMVDFSWQPDMR